MEWCNQKTYWNSFMTYLITPRAPKLTYSTLSSTTWTSIGFSKWSFQNLSDATHHTRCRHRSFFTNTLWTNQSRRRNTLDFSSAMTRPFQMWILSTKMLTKYFWDTTRDNWITWSLESAQMRTRTRWTRRSMEKASSLQCLRSTTRAPTRHCLSPFLKMKRAKRRSRVQTRSRKKLAYTSERTLNISRRCGWIL